MIPLILAAGPDDGWKGPFPKQLCPLAGKPLLLWTLESFGGGVVVTNKPEIMALDVAYFVPEDTTTIFDTILSTRALWAERTLVLSGDQFYRDDMVSEILEYDGETPVVFWSHTLLFDEKDYEAIEAMLARLAAEGKRGDFFNRLKITAGIPQVAKVKPDLDFDILPYYEKFLEENLWAR